TPLTRAESRWRWARWAAAGAGVAGLIAWPWICGWGAGSAWMAAALLVTVALPAVFPRNLAIGAWFAVLAAMVIRMGADLFGGSFSWLKVGFFYGTDQYRNMHAGTVYNLAGLLNHSYGWRLDHEVQWSGRTLQITMRWVYVALLLVMGACAAAQARR